MKALVLAGGQGTRLRPLTYAMAKQLVPVANKPILHYALDSLFQGGIRDFGIIISPETGESIRDSVGQWQRALPEACDVTFILQDLPLGLAHAVRTARGYLQDDPFVMYLGDNLINVNMASLIDRFQTGGFDAAILLKPVENPSAFGVAELDDTGAVVRLVEKPQHPVSNLALIGVYFFTPHVFEAIARIKPSWRGELEITDAIQQLIEDHYHVGSSQHDGWWLDTGKKDDLLAANRVVLEDYLRTDIQGVVDAATRVSGVVEIGPDTVVDDCRITGPVKIGAGCILRQATIGPYTSIGDRSRVEGCALENSVLLGQCTLENVSAPIEDSLLGKGCTIIQNRERPDRHQFLLADHSVVHVL